MKFPELIKQVRDELYETQAEFGKRFEVSHASVSDWESGKTEAPYKVLSFVLQKIERPLTLEDRILDLEQQMEKVRGFLNL